MEKRLAESGRFRPEDIHSTDNVISLPVEVHRRITAKMNSNLSSNMRILTRRWIERAEFSEQYNFGRELIKRTLEEAGHGR